MKMVKSLTVVVAAFALAGSAFAKDEKAPPAKKITKRYMATGGKVQVPNSQKGKIVIFNAQKKIPLSEYRAPLDDFMKRYKYRVEFADSEVATPGSAGDIMKRFGAQVGVFLVERQDMPLTSLVAPDARWAIVNVAEVTRGAKSAVFEAARTRKALMRAFLCAAGGMNSQYQGSAMTPITTPDDYDKIIEDPPVDVIMRADSVLRYAGVEPAQFKYYIEACQEGWAPQPSDQYQKAIWDKVHETPSGPIKIEYDPKTGK